MDLDPNNNVVLFQQPTFDLPAAVTDRLPSPDIPAVAEEATAMMARVDEVVSPRPIVFFVPSRTVSISSSDESDTIGDITMYRELVCRHEKQTARPRREQGKCVINLMEFEPGDYYYLCPRCENQLRRWH